MRTINHWPIHRGRIELHFYSKHRQDTWLLLHPCTCAKCSALSGSANETDLSRQKRYSLTRLILKASARYSTPSFSMSFCSRSTILTVFKENERALLVTESFYFINLQGIGKGLENCGINRRRPKIEYYECLWRERDDKYEEHFFNLIDFQRFSKRLNSFIANRIRRKIEHCEWLSTVKIVANNESGTRDCLTSLFFKASVRYWTPVGPILLAQRFNGINVYQQKEWSSNDKTWGLLSHLIDFQCIRKILENFIANLTALQKKCGQCLEIICVSAELENEKRSYLTRLNFNASARTWAPVLSILFCRRFNVSSVCQVWFYRHQERQGEAICFYSIDLQ